MVPAPRAANLRAATKPFSRRDENVLKQSPATLPLSSNAGFGHAGIDPKPDLPRISQERAFGHTKAGSTPMTEVVAAVLVFFSISVFLAHAVDAYRAGR
jgi:hypothetical protein